MPTLKKYERVMLIDDSELDNLVNKKIIETSSFAEKIYVSTNGVSAIEFLKNLGLLSGIASRLLPEVIFVDLNMPVMDGFGFMKTLISLTGHNINNFKLVVLSSTVNENDAQAVKQISNEIVFLKKPLTPEMLGTL